MSVNTKDDVILLLHEADPGPARSKELARRMAEPDAIRSRAVRLGEEEATPREDPKQRVASHRLRRIALAAALGAGVVAAALSILPLSGDEGPRESSPTAGDPTEGTFANAFDALTTASAVAATGSSEGTYPYYTRLLVHESGIGDANTWTGSNTPRFVVGETVERETWFRADGSSHVRYTTSGAEFPSLADEELERAERQARPGLSSPYPPAFEDSFDISPRESRVAAPDRLGCYGLEPAGKRLPRDPEELAKLLESIDGERQETAQRTACGIPTVNSPAGDLVQVFHFVSALLLFAPYDEDLRAAAYDLAAGLDGVELDGRARDPVGRLGTSVSFEAALGRGYRPGPLTRHSLIFDTDTGEPLASVKEQVNPRTDTGSPVADYLVLLDAGPVDSVGERPE